jgi:hypothetical protein
VLAEVGHPDHPWMLDQQSEQPAPFGQVAHPGTLLGVDAHVDELGQALARAQHT